jgi:hypothetical protein
VTDGASVGTIHTTYFAALQHEQARPAAADHVLGVVRDPHEWVDELVDRNLQILGPPADLLSVFREVEAAADADGVDNPARVAWQSVGFEDRYRSYLETGSTAEALDSLLADLEAGRDLWLVCYEADDAACHRRLLREVLQERLADRVGADVAAADRNRSRQDITGLRGLADGHHISDRACPPTEHVWQTVSDVPFARRCIVCGYSEQALVDTAGQDLPAGGGST